MRFFKYHGTGNDFIVISAMHGALPLDTGEIADLCRRCTGVGADGVIFACPARTGADAAMRLFNADGSEAEMSGNGIRCLAKYLYEQEGMRRQDLIVETGSGARMLRLHVRGGMVEEVEVDMGTPEFGSPDIPPADDPSRPGTVSLTIPGGADVAAFCVSMGNPHCVVFVEDVDAAPVGDLGPRLESHPAFPSRTNVEFAQLLNRERMRLRVWERGVGETRSCGTGASAAFAAALQSAKGKKAMAVELPGGVLSLHADEFGHIILCGPVVEVFRGELGIRWRG